MVLTDKQRRRQAYRSSGKYAKVNPCELCRKSAGEDYFSWQHCDEHGIGVTLCEPCADDLAVVAEADGLQMLTRSK